MLNKLLFLAFLMDEVIELHHTDVDINPQYAESLDTEIFKVHLMFDNTNRNESSLPNQMISLPTFAALGPDSFRSGLDEVRFA